MFAIHPFPCLCQSMRRHFCEVWACEMQDFAKSDTVGAIFIGDNVDHHSELGTWNGSDSNHIVTLHESNTPPFVFCDLLWGVVGLWCIAFDNLEVGWAYGFGNTWKWDWGIGSVTNVESLHCGKRISLYCNWCIRETTPLFLRDLYLSLLAMC